MGETTDQIEQHIRQTREQLGDNFNELEEKVKTAVDWRAQFEERPGTMMALAFGGGVVLAALFPGRRSSRPTDYTAASSGEPRDVRAFYNSRASADEDNQTPGSWDALKGALIGVATSKITDFIEEVVPGFQREFTRAKDKQRAATSGDGRSWQQSGTAAD